MWPLPTGLQMVYGANSGYLSAPATHGSQAASTPVQTETRRFNDALKSDTADLNSQQILPQTFPGGRLAYPTRAPKSRVRPLLHPAI